ncbi:MAG TPA: response regulator, partial [Thermoanaerobaculia bacterium]|nr:response regulator [Thermoanaerobaculia bacterium]
MARRVLVVDDDPGIRDALRMILEYEGYQVATAAEGKTALATLEAD